MDTITSVYTIASHRLPGVEAKIEKLNRRARRLKLPVITVKPLRVFPKEVTRRGNTFEEQYTEVEVTGTRPKLAGWEFAATLEHDYDTGLTILRSSEAFKAAPIPVQYRKATPVCDHCRQQRNRKDTFLCYSETAGFKQIGRNCLVDFLGGIDPHSIAAAAEIWFDVQSVFDEDYDGEGGWGGGSSIVLDLEGFIRRAFAVVRVKGFLGRAKAREQQLNIQPTADVVLDLLLPTTFLLNDKKWQELDRETVPSAQDIERTTLALEWVRGLDVDSGKLSDYEHNLFVGCASELLPTRRAGIVASLPAAYLKYIDRQEELRKQREGRKPSNFVGTVGERIEIVATLTKVHAIESEQWGTSYLHKFEADNGDRFAWFSSSQSWLEGQQYRFDGTVKEHKDDEKWGKETLIGRCKCKAVLTAWEGEIVGSIGDLYVVTRNGEVTLNVVSRVDGSEATRRWSIDEVESDAKRLAKKATVQWIDGFSHVQYDKEDVSRHASTYTDYSEEKAAWEQISAEFPGVTRENVLADNPTAGAIRSKEIAPDVSLVLFLWAGRCDVSLRTRRTVRPAVLPLTKSKAKPKAKREKPAGEAPSASVPVVSSTFDPNYVERIDSREFYDEPVKI